MTTTARWVPDAPSRRPLFWVPPPTPPAPDSSLTLALSSSTPVYPPGPEPGSILLFHPLQRRPTWTPDRASLVRGDVLRGGERKCAHHAFVFRASHALPLPHPQLPGVSLLSPVRIILKPGDLR